MSQADDLLPDVVKLPPVTNQHHKIYVLCALRVLCVVVSVYIYIYIYIIGPRDNWIRNCTFCYLPINTTGFSGLLGSLSALWVFASNVAIKFSALLFGESFGLPNTSAWRCEASAPHNYSRRAG